MSIDADSLARLVGRPEALAERAETLLPPPPPAVELGAAVASRWRATLAGGRFQPVLRALQWALDRGSKSGRGAHRFARDRVDRRALGETG